MVILMQFCVDQCIMKIVRPRKCNNKSVVFGNSSACFFKNAADGGPRNAIRVVFTVVEYQFFQIFLGVCWKACSSFLAVANKILR